MTNFEYKNSCISKSENWFFICFSSFRIFPGHLATFEKNYCPMNLFVWLRIFFGSGPHPPLGLRPWSSHTLRLRTLASLISVNGIFRKNVFQIFFNKKNLFKNGYIFRKYAHCSENDSSVHECFCATLYKIWNIIFHSIQHCGHLSCKYNHFWGGEGSVLCTSFLGTWPIDVQVSANDIRQIEDDYESVEKNGEKLRIYLTCLNFVPTAQHASNVNTNKFGPLPNELKLPTLPLPHFENSKGESREKFLHNFEA